MRVCRDWMRYAIPCILLFLALMMVWRRQQRGKQHHLEAFKVAPPPSRNPVEQLLALQEAISHLETFLQAGNIILLKLRALLFSALPQATDKVVVGLLVLSAVFAVVPLKVIVALAALEAYTREMPLRKDCSDKWARRLREWWIRIPAAPVVLMKHGDNKKTK
ncbi:hypothetical protein ACHQM5_012145 [Ranunculus cassubicifolius]